jgi:predicted transcriptional regulator
MNTIPITPERQAELEKFATKHGQSPAELLDDAIVSYLAWQKQDYAQAVEGIAQGYEDMKAGRTRPAENVFEDLRRRHGFPD